MTNAASEKSDKRLYNRRYRRVCKMFLRKFDEDDSFPLLREYSNVWAMDKDGKNWFDVTEFPKYMRK
jgi:hypothetical protein